MIHILTITLKVIATIIAIIISYITILISLLMWDKYYLTITSNLIDTIWDENNKLQIQN